MPDRNQLQHLLRLIDDEMPEVRDAVMRELASFGNGLQRELVALPEAPKDDVVRAILDDVVAWQSRGGAAESAALYRVGQLVHHRRYDYRGVIVSVDSHCTADNDWYEKNRTQPHRQQPWYHVFVHLTDQVTYAAQTSLEADHSIDVIVHPLVDYFFTGMENGRYIRNDRPWAGWEGE